MCYDRCNMENIERIKGRASKLRRQFDHIGWRGVCRRCGIARNLLGKEIYDKITKEYNEYNPGDDMECNSPRCTGTLHFKGRMSEKRAVHLADILRRQ